MKKSRYDLKENSFVLINVFNSGYLISVLLYLAGSIGSLCDGVITSKTLGVSELAAIGIVYPYVKTMECISLAFSSGSQVIIGRKIGQNKFEEVSKVFYTSMVSIIALSVAIALLISLFAGPVSKLFGASERGQTLSPTVDYLVSLAVGAPAHLLTLYLIPLFQLDEKKKLINISAVAMTTVNVALNILFMKCGMGIKGIGYSTSISYYVALIILSVHFIDKERGVLLQGQFGIDRKYLPETVREGAPSAFKNVTSIVFNMAVNNILAAYAATEAMAAYSVWKLTKFIFLCPSEAIINPVRMTQSILWEEKDRKMLRRIFKFSIIKGISLSTLMSAFLLVFGRRIFSVMVSGAVLDETVSLINCTLVIYITNTVVCYYLAYFQVIGKNRIVFSISIVLNIVTLPLFYLLGKSFGAKGVWMSFAIQFVIITVYVLAWAFIMGRRNEKTIDKLLVLPCEEDEDYATYDFHIQSPDDAASAVTEFGMICAESVHDKKKSYYCCLALEEIVFNIIEYQKAHYELEPNIDVHIIIFSNRKMVMRIKDCSKERNPFVKYEYQQTGNDWENLGIKILKSFAEDIHYSFIYGVNFISITV